MTDKDIKDYCKNCDVEPPAMKFKCPECEHNTDKEQIIIDGKGCRYRTWDKDCALTGDNHGDNMKPCKFIDEKNCYYKQSKRKEQECENLNKRVSSLEEIADDLQQRNHHLTQKCKKLNNKIIDMNSIIEDAAINLGNKDFTLYDLPFEIKKLSQECDTLKSQLDLGVQQKECFEQECEELKEKYEALKLENQEGYEIVAELKQECEELKGKYKNILDLAKQNADANEYCLQELEQENYRYRKALDEIEKYTIKQFCENCDDFNTTEYNSHCEYCEYYEYFDIINKAKGEVNE